MTSEDNFINGISNLQEIDQHARKIFHKICRTTRCLRTSRYFDACCPRLDEIKRWLILGDIHIRVHNDGIWSVTFIDGSYMFTSEKGQLHFDKHHKLIKWYQ